MATGDQHEAALIRRWRRGHAATAHRQLELSAAEGPDPEQAVAEALSAFELLSRATAHPSQRDPVSEREVQEVRRRWARIQKRARALAEAPELVDGPETIVTSASDTRHASTRRAGASRGKRKSKR